MIYWIYHNAMKTNILINSMNTFTK